MFIHTDVVDKDLPLLLSKAFMKSAGMILNFKNDTLYCDGESLPLHTSHSGHYILPLTKPVQLINNLTDSTEVILTLNNDLSNIQIAEKLHRQFAHASKEKLFQLIRLAGKPWKDNTNLIKAIDDITTSCQVCQKFQKAPSRPIVGLPMATQFLETVALDLKFIEGKPILHLIDLCTRLSAASVIANKNPETVISKILQIWISVYGATNKFLVDNGGEFANDAFINLAEKFGITVKTTAGYSPWSNGIIERHNQTLGQMIEKVLADSTCDLPTAVSWCVSAKNSLANHCGFTPFQLSIGTNPKLPTTLTDGLPSLTAPVTSKTLSEHLQAIHKAREAFIQCENSERIRRALTHNVRSSGDTKYLTGDSVLFKRDNSSAWHGPGTVLGQDGQQILIKHGSYYVRAHPCRVRLVQEPLRPEVQEPEKSMTSIPVVQDSTPEPRTQSLVLTQSLPNSTSTNSISPTTESSEQEESHIDNANNISNAEINDQSNVDAPLTPSVSNAPLNTLPFKLQPGLNVKFVNNKGESVTSQIDTRAGKAKGQYPHWWNTTRADGSKEAIDFSKVTSLELIQEPVNESTVENTFIANTKETIHNAKIKELDNWKNQSVYSEVVPNNQDTISLRWVCTPKVIDGVPSIKARLVAKGFQEQQNVRGDSPTCSREGVKLTLALIASQSWTLRSLDISTAFLQGGPINREVYVLPPKEAETEMIWKLNKSVYGLNDASRNWYLKLREELIKLGGKPMQLDQGIFCWYKENKLVGLMVCFVDDILYAGDDTFDAVVIKLKQQFVVGSENVSKFHYIGINIKQYPNAIVISQSDYVAKLEPIPLTSIDTSNSSRELVEVEKTLLRGALGQLNWLSGITRPEISFSVSEISSRITSSNVGDILSINKTIKFVKSSPAYITIRKLDLSSLKIVSFSDSSFNNLPKGNSQGAHVVFLADDKNNSCPVSWSSNKIKRVVRSTLAAETLAFTEAADTAFYIQKLLIEILQTSSIPAIPIMCLTDSQSLFETIGTSHQTTDRRLRVEISAIREMVEKEEISVEWVSKDKQLSDVLTKKGASPMQLMSSLQRGSLSE